MTSEEREVRSFSKAPSGDFQRVLDWARRWNLSERLSAEKIMDLLDTLRRCPEVGRTVIEMDDAGYERMRDALGSEWEWRGLVVMRVNNVSLPRLGTSGFKGMEPTNDTE